MINGAAFGNLNKLTSVYFGKNECINENFTDPTRIAVMPQILNNNCGSCKSNGEIRNCDMLHELRALVIEKQKGEAETCRPELETTTIDLAKLTTQLDLLFNFKIDLEFQYQQLLEAQTAELKKELKKKDETIIALEENIKIINKTNQLRN